MAKHFVQRVPLLRFVVPLTFVVDDQLRKRLRVRRQANRCLQLFSGHFSIMVTVDDVVQTTLHRSFVRRIGQGAMTFELSFAEAVNGPKKGGQSLPRGVVVEDRVVALP